MIKKIAVGLILMVVSTGVAYAAWTIFGQVTNNVFAVGTLTTNVSGTALAVAKGMPGDPPVTQTITVTNTGDKDVMVRFNTTPTYNSNGACDYVRLTLSANWYSGQIYGPATYTVNEWVSGGTIADGTKPLIKADSMNVTVNAFLDSGAPQSVELGNCTWNETFTSE
jgi:hypothetical protein